MSVPYVLGVDVSHQRVRAALADERAIVAEVAEPTRQGSARELIAQFIGLAGRLTAHVGVHGGDSRSVLRGVGVSIPGEVDPRTGLPGAVPVLPGLSGADLKDALGAAFGVPVAVENDANVAALAEGRYGAAVGIGNYVVVLVRSGIGTGIVVDGQLCRGAHGRAGELAGLPLQWGTERTSPGDYRAYEGGVAGRGLRERISQAAAHHPGSALSAAHTFSDVAKAALRGDAPSAALVAEEAALLALGLAAVIAVVDPELIALGGEIGSTPELLDPLMLEIDKLVAHPPRIVTSHLGDRGELLGALEAARGAAADELAAD
jgi:predicted NBD/HSP70 family sugar kinase